jgi:hypothetical protein
MESVEARRHYTSRWSDDPILDERRRPRLVQLTPRDIEIFKTLGRYRYLRADFIHAFVGGNLSGLVGRLNLLQRRPNRYLRRPEAQRQFARADYRYLIYELGAPGEAVLRELGLWDAAVVRIGDEKQFAHAMMINDTLASLELGVRASPHVRIIPWRDIYERQTFPDTTRAGAAPHILPVDISYTFPSGKRQRVRFDYTSDCHGAFGLEYNGDRPAYRFFSHESEHKNALERGTLEQTSFLRKFLALRYIHERELYRSRWGLPNLYHLVTAPTRAHLENMKALILRETRGAGDRNILFREVPALGDVLRTARPAPELFTEPWERAGFGPLDISRP